MTYFDLIKLNLASANALKGFDANCNGNRHNEVALRTTCIKSFKLKTIKLRTGCQYIGYFHYSENLNWATQNL